MQKFYLTTAISYPNATPHIGHAYEAIAADVLARAMRKRLGDDNVRFLTGTDEHGLKMVQTARERGITARQLADENSVEFEYMARKLNIGYSRFIRTTDQDHYETARSLWTCMAEDMYLGRYTGWYSTRDEAYFDESELVDGKTPTGNPVEWLEEESWFFRLTDYRDRLKAHFAANPDFVQPLSARNKIISMLDDLQDISVSRTSFDWGIPVPNSPGHVMYVWVDALANYLTGADPGHGRAGYWPADVHIIGKDIIKFHAIYWPAFLMSARLPLPKKIFAHGFLTIDGEKMSKSVGNVINPVAVSSQYGVDALRYFLMSEFTFGDDGNYSDEALVRRVNAEVANGLGNLLSRTCALVTKKFGGTLPKSDLRLTQRDRQLIEEVGGIISTVIPAAYDRLAFSQVCGEWNRAVKLCDQYIAAEAPWAKDQDLTRTDAILNTLIICISYLAEAIEPIIPTYAGAVIEHLAKADTSNPPQFARLI